MLKTEMPNYDGPSSYTVATSVLSTLPERCSMFLVYSQSLINLLDGVDSSSPQHKIVESQLTAALNQATLSILTHKIEESVEDENEAERKPTQGDKMETIVVNGKTYYSNPQAEITGDLKIVILQRGWVMIGKLERNGSECKLHNASVIRNWGTTRGLGELATEGKKKDTKLDPCGGVVEFDYLTVVATIAVDASKWN